VRCRSMHLLPRLRELSSTDRASTPTDLALEARRHVDSDGPAPPAWSADPARAGPARPHDWPQHAFQSPTAGHQEQSRYWPDRAVCPDVERHRIRARLGAVPLTAGSEPPADARCGRDCPGRRRAAATAVDARLWS
jgi:hypothetical protein